MTLPANVVTYSFPTTIYFGAQARHALPQTLADAGIKRPLLVTDRTLAPTAMVRDIIGSLRDKGFAAEVFAGTGGNPVKSHVVAGAAARYAHGSDAIIALGGGAALDVGKAVALMAHHPGDLFDYAADAAHPRAISEAMPYLAAIPTTAGTGSEVGRSSVISDDTTHTKKIIFSARLLPQAVFADPELTLGLPPAITAATGMDALTHLLESYLSRGHHPMCDGIALEGLGLVRQSLVACVGFAQHKVGSTAEHVEARGHMLLAALMGAVAFQKGLGVTHSAAHALSTVCDVHHGLANGIMLPVCMAFNWQHVPQRFDAMAYALRMADGAELLAWLKELQTTIGIPATLRAVGVGEEHVAKLVRVAMHDGCHLENPVPVDAAQFTRLFTEALG